MNNLPIPQEVEKDEGSCEVVRVWVLGNGKLITVHGVGVWDKNAVWGILLADLARNISAGAYEISGENPIEEIIEAFNTEVTSPTSELSGVTKFEQ